MRVKRVKTWKSHQIEKIFRYVYLLTYGLSHLVTLTYSNNWFRIFCQPNSKNSTTTIKGKSMMLEMNH